MLNRILLALALTCLTALAQNGDKVGEKQESLIPADKIPPAPPLPPDQALKSFKLPPGFKIELVASEPMIETPIVVQWDANGRLWVIEMRSYMLDPTGAGETRPISQISILEDSDGDGRMDKKTVFLDKLVMPRAMAFAQDGLLVCEPPALWYYPILAGDKPGKRVLVDADYSKAADPKLGRQMNPEHSPNSLTWTLDNWLYSAKSAFKYRLDEGDWKKQPTAFKGQWGLSQDNYGRILFNSNSDHLRMEPAPSEYLLRNPFYRSATFSYQPLKDQTVWPARMNPGVNRGYKKGTLRPDGRLARYTGASGPGAYRGNHFPPEFQNDVFIPEPTGNFVRRDDVTEKNGKVSATNPYAKAESEFLASTDEIFRPVNCYTGPDGALYVVDMYQGIIQHRYFLTSYLRKQAESRGLDKVARYGRIYRVVHTGRPLDQGPKLAGADSATLVKALSHPNGWYRDTAQRILVQKAPGSAVVPLRAHATGGSNPLGRLHALWTLGGMKYLDLETLQKVLPKEKDAKVIAAAIRLCEPLLATFERDDVVALLIKQIGNRNYDVQLQLALTLGDARIASADAALVRIANQNLADGTIRDAILSGLVGRESAFITRLAADNSWKNSNRDREKLIGELAKCVIIQGRRASVNGLLDFVSADTTPDWQKTAIIVGMTPVKPKSTKGLPPVRQKKIQLTEKPSALEQLKSIESKSVQTALAKLDEVLVWPGKPGVKPEPPVRPLTDSENALFLSGKALYQTSCGACHQPHGFGLPGLAPPLADSEWVSGSADRLVRIVLHGVDGPIVVLGQKYNLEMPGHGTFSDEQIASVLTYVRREWDHPYDPVSPKKVADVRKQSGPREEGWTMEELLKIK